MNKLILAIIVFTLISCNNNPTNYMDVMGKRYEVNQVLNKVNNDSSKIIFVANNDYILEVDFPYRIDKLEYGKSLFKFREDIPISYTVYKKTETKHYSNVHGLVHIGRDVGKYEFKLNLKNNEDSLKIEYTGILKDYDKSIEYVDSIPKKKESPFKNYVEINNQFYEVERVLQREQGDTCVMFFINSNNYGIELFIPKNISKLASRGITNYYLDKKGVKYITYTENGKEEHTSHGNMLVSKKGGDTDFYFSISNIKGSYFGYLNSCINSAMNYIEIKNKQFDIETAKYEKREKGCSIKFFYNKNKEIEISIYKDLSKFEQASYTMSHNRPFPIYISRENDIFNFNIETISGKDTVKIEYMGELKGQELVKIELKEKIENYN